MKVRIKFRKYGVMRFIGHLDVMRFFQKAIRRAEIPIAFTSGYSPHMIMSFAQPLGVGITSDSEYLDIELTEPIASAQAVKQLNAVMVEGIDVVSFREISSDKKASGMTIVAAAEYKVTFPKTFQHAEDTKALPENLKNAVQKFLDEEQILVWKKTKRSEKEVNIKPMIYDMKTEANSIYLFLATGSEQNLKPDLVIEALLRFAGENPQEVPLHYHRLEVYAKNPEGTGTEHEFLSLEALGHEISDNFVIQA